MATSTAMQSILSSPMTRFTGGTRFSPMIPSSYVPRSSCRNAGMRVRCKAEEGQKEEPSPVSAPPPSTQPNPVPAPAPKVGTKFSEVFAFSGPAPERINGRLAMIGFVAAMGVELANGQDLFAQISNGGVPWFLATSIVLSVASVIPLFNGVSVESKSEGVMTSDAELLNGRLAMLGLVALAFTEYVKGGALV